MVTTNRYFTIALDAVPDEPDFDVWYYAWTRNRPAHPTKDMLVIGVTDGGFPPGATLVGENSKDPPPPPPPPPPQRIDHDELRRTFAAWFAVGRGA